MQSFCEKTFVFFEPHPLVRKGLQALIDPLNVQVCSFQYLREIVANLNMNIEGKKTVIMELYHHKEKLYDVMQFILVAKRYWPKVSFVIFTDITNPSILSILASEPHLSLVSKRDNLDHLLAAISAAHYSFNYRSPLMQQILQQEVRPLSHSEWHILKLMVGGANAQLIARETQRSYKTICTHKLNIMRKLGVNSVGFMLLVLTFRTRYWK